ncbi:MAG: repair protein SbcC/Rad50 [Micromonosporaceae bacterium]|nr:repair protein SbcC/Rad50 [Micromonosporaceae bacterium]
MRPLRIDLHGFTVFRDPTTVDLTDADFFVLVGPTGSGKSTVLDAICFALYGTVPRWGDRRRIDNALAPSASEARVRLVFESSGVRFVATRVVRRDSKGKVSTSHAGLEQLPPGFDVASFALAPTERAEAGLGTVLAGTPAEMDAAVAEAVGLPYDQFTSCVVLPQGEFARFLHAKPAERQEILVNLLGLHVYQRIGERAGALQREAEAKAAATGSLLGDVSGADDAALAAAEEALTRGRALVADVERELPALAEATAAGKTAGADLTRVERDMATLAAVKTPRGVATLGDEAAAAREAAAKADAAVLAAEEHEEKIRAELAAAGDKTALTRLVDAHRERATHVTRVEKLAAAVAAAKAGHDSVAAALATAHSKAAKATAAVTAAQQAIEMAQTADRAASLRVHLVAGEPCPVCEQNVGTVPATPAPALAAARAKHAQAEKAAQAAVKAAEGHDRALRESDRGLAAATAQHEESIRRLAAIEAVLKAAPTLSTVEAELAAIATAERVVGAAAEAVRAARQAARTAATRARQSEDTVRAAWREFDQVRDGLAPLGPPPADRDDLVASWQALQEWAGANQIERGQERDAILAVAEAALAAITHLAARLETLFREAGLPPVVPPGDPAAYRQAAALAVERAAAAQERVLERRAQAARLAEQVAEHEREAQVAKSLSLHLRADRFERWLLAEALDALVLGASQILRELSSGQYDLTHDKGEFFVIDHSDAGLRRGVRTLSGGETFQASLALALALSEQLAGLSTSSASLESIMLDEGFGTLDAATLDTVAATLENLASRGDRMVGVVTHVAALAERIPVRFEVSKDARGAAKIIRC